jgi:transcriptional regulator with XRE-family HTH domain
MSIADNIKRLREQKGVVQNEVAAEMVLGVPKSPALAHPKLMRKRY